MSAVFTSHERPASRRKTAPSALQCMVGVLNTTSSAAPARYTPHCSPCPVREHSTPGTSNRTPPPPAMTLSAFAAPSHLSLRASAHPHLLVPRGPQRPPRAPRLPRCRAPFACAPPPAPSASSFALSDLPLLPLSSCPALPGAYAVRSASGALRYVGYSRDVRARLGFHLRAVGPEEAAGAHVYAPADARKVTPDMLESVLEFWVQENGGVVPEGNSVARAAWEGRVEGVEEAKRRHEVLVRNVLTFILFSSVLKTAHYLFLPY